MRAAQGAKFNRLQGLLFHKVDNRKRVKRAESVVGDVSGAAVGGSDNFVGVFTDGDSGDNLESDGIDDGQRVVLL